MAEANDPSGMPPSGGIRAVAIVAIATIATGAPLLIAFTAIALVMLLTIGDW